MATSVCDSDYGHEIQGLVVMSCERNTSNNQIIKKIIRHSNQSSNESQEYEPKSLKFGSDININGFDLKIDNKYYSANIFLFDIEDKNLFNERLSDSVNGVIVYFDSNEDSSFGCVKSSLSYINQFDNQMKLLVSQTIDDTKRQDIMMWCLDNEFELIELCPQFDPNDDDIDNDLEDVDGMTRILQSIEAYHWPKSELKDPPKYNPSQHFKNLIEKEVSNDVNGVNGVNGMNEPPNEIDFINQLSDNLSDSQETQDFENFNLLFEKFNEMKVKSSQMNETERKDYAEKVTIAFWKAIGGDINEIEGLEDKD